MFQVSVVVQLGDGAKALFWIDRWLGGKSIQQITSAVFQAVHHRARNSPCVGDALQSGSWLLDITGSRTVTLIAQVFHLVDLLQDITTTPGVEDTFVWRWSPSGTYTAASAYRMFFAGQASILGAKELSKVKAPAKCKFFVWLAILGRCWTSDRLRRHNMRNNGPCALCAQEPETIDHLLLGCVFSREVWFKILRSSGAQGLAPTHDASMADWWLTVRKRVAKQWRAGFDSLVVLTSWEIWRERNRRVFQQTNMQPVQLIGHIKDEGHAWAAAGFSGLSHFFLQ